LVKGTAHNYEPGPLSDSNHNTLQVVRPGDPDPIDTTDEVLHLCLVI